MANKAYCDCLGTRSVLQQCSDVQNKKIAIIMLVVLTSFARCRNNSVL